MRTLRSKSRNSHSDCKLHVADSLHRAWIHSFTGKLKGKPLLDMAAGLVEDYEFLWDQYYFPTATL